MANKEEYIIPLGVDGTNIAQGLADLSQGLDNLGTAGEQAGKNVSQGLAQGAKATEALDKSVKSSSKNLEAMREAGSLLGKEMAGALKGGDTSVMEAKIDAFKAKLHGITATVDVELDDSKVQAFEKEMENAKDGVDELNAVMKVAKEIMAEMDPNSEEYQQLASAIEFTDSAISTFNSEMGETVEKSKSLKAELRTLQAQMAEMEMAGEANSEAFAEMAQRAGELKDQIGDTSAQVNILASDTAPIDGLLNGLEGLAGGMALAQGTMALFGEENEDLEKALVKLTAVMSILQGVQAVQNVLNKDSAFSVLYLSKAKLALANTGRLLAGVFVAETAATSAATLATNVFSLALKAIGIGLIITAIALLVEYWDDLVGAVNKFLPAGESISKQFDKLKAVVMGLGNAILQYFIAPIKAGIDIINGDFDKAVDDFVKGMDVVNNFKKGYQYQTTQNDLKYAMERKIQSMKDWDFQIQLEEARGKDVYNTRKKWHENNIRMLKIQGKDTEEALKDQQMFEAQHEGDLAKEREQARKKAEAEAKKRADEAKRKAEEARKAREEQAKKDADLARTYGEELQDIETSAIKEASKKAVQEIQDATVKKVAELRRDGAKSVEAINAREDLIKKILADAEREKAELVNKFEKEKLAKQLEYDKGILELQTESKDRALSILTIETQQKLDKINEDYKNQEALRERLTEEVIAKDAKTRQELNIKYGAEDLEKQEKIQLAGIELSSKYAKESEKTERQKQIAIMETKLDFAEKTINMMVANGKLEGSAEIQSMRATVANLRKELKKTIEENDGKGFDLFEFLGLDTKITGKQKQMLKQAFSAISQSLKQITDFMIDQYDRQIEKKQEVIDQLDEDISTLESDLDKEKELRENGFANNVEVLQKELDAKKAQREEELKQQEELQKKKKALQRMEMIADTAYQAVGLITASVDIFKSFAKLPFGIGIPLAIAVVGAMVGAFVAGKVKAFQAVNDGAKFQGGGRLTRGNLHAHGGKKFYSADGDNVELEQGEYVTNRISANKYANMLEAMNADDWSNLSRSDSGLQEMFSKMGLSFNTDEIFKANSLFRGMTSVMHAPQSPYMSSIDQSLKFLVHDAKTRPISWADDMYIYTKTGNKTIKVRIKPKPVTDGTEE